MTGRREGGGVFFIVRLFADEVYYDIQWRRGRRREKGEEGIEYCRGEEGWRSRVWGSDGDSQKISIITKREGEKGM